MEEYKHIYVADYNTALNTIPKPPRELYVRGADHLLNSQDPLICIVGSRAHTAYGERVAKYIIDTLTPYNPIIVSGLATGIDSIVHTYALSNHLRCVAVLGCGLDDETIYPRENLHLAKRLLDSGNLLISEYPPGTKPDKWRFPMRNRIMAGISSVIVIIEGGAKSGTLITGKIGLEYGRDIFCVPGSIFSRASDGPHTLICEGATPLINPLDILSAIGIKPIDKTGGSSETPPFLPIPESCSAIEKHILHILEEEDITINKLSQKLEMDLDDLYIHITCLEVKKLITQKYGKIVRL